MSTTDCYETTDLGIAAFLVAQDIPLLGLAPGQGRQRIFRFPAHAAEVAPGYYRNVPVRARPFFCAVRDLKAMLRET